jgi:hypothetical protein
MTWAGHIATEHNTSLTLVYNFAISGSTVDNEIIQAYAPDIPSMTDQMTTWLANLKEHPGYAPWTSENTLFFIWVGINDVGNSFSQPGIQGTLTKDLDRLLEHIETLWDSGARNFALLNVPRMSTPLQRQGPGPEPRVPLVNTPVQQPKKHPSC